MQSCSTMSFGRIIPQFVHQKYALLCYVTLTTSLRLYRKFVIVLECTNRVHKKIEFKINKKRVHKKMIVRLNKS